MAEYRALHKLQICFTDNQYNALKKLSELNGETMAAIVRRMVNKEIYAEILNRAGTIKKINNMERKKDEQSKEWGNEKRD